MTSITTLAVVGHPIGHSLSPVLHRAAYQALGLDWKYEAVDVQPGELTNFIDSADVTLRGLSVTMPHKTAALEIADHFDLIAEQTQSVNTLMFDYSSGLRVTHGFNTDVSGIVHACHDVGVQSARHVAVVGSGATASSAVVGAAELGAEHVSVIARTPQNAFKLEQVGQRAGVSVSVTPLSQIQTVSPVDLAISTLPGEVEQSLNQLSRVPHAALLDVAYSPWPSRRGTEWASLGGEVISGLRMLAHQALIQVRIFVLGNPFEKLPNEETVKTAMFEAVSL
ncbi:shikimate dehydrogenase [Aurantimicrobium sp. INA4]|uniref:shikimate dehydrogenase family protein n=1 Tax=Aurantimicrobium sp. INA4 TaxID=2986279 RepID=UPI00249314FC|nr:shikimate dehydrogenase [Aurantimicrobium sp. INA4]BDU10902.1 shikimate dehydrogenase [Aurantimicrobium sp. INA4]